MILTIVSCNLVSIKIIIIINSATAGIGQQKPQASIFLAVDPSPS